MLEGLAVDETSKRVGGFGNSAGEQRPDLVQQPALELPIHARPHAGRRLFRRQPDGKRKHLDLRDRRHRRSEVFGEGPAGKKEHFDRADAPFQVARLNSVGRRGVDPPEQAVQKHDAAAGGNRFESRAQPAVPSRSREQAARQRAIVEAGAAHEERQSVPRMDVADRGSSVAGILRGRILRGRLDDVDEMVRDTTLFGQWDLVGADVESTIDRGRIAIDDLAATALGERESECALPRRGRTQDGDDLTAPHYRAEANDEIRDEEADENQQPEPLRSREHDLIVRLHCRKTSR